MTIVIGDILLAKMPFIQTIHEIKKQRSPNLAIFMFLKLLSFLLSRMEQLESLILPQITLWHQNLSFIAHFPQKMVAQSTLKMVPAYNTVFAA